MSVDPAGEWGLRHRIRLAYQGLGSYRSVALILGVSPLVIEDFLEEASYIPEEGDLATIVANLPNLLLDSPIAGKTQAVKGMTYHYFEAPVWDAYLLDQMPVPDGGAAFSFRYWAGYAHKQLRSTGFYLYPDHDPAQTWEDLADVDPESELATVVWKVVSPSESA